MKNKADVNFGVWAFLVGLLFAIVLSAVSLFSQKIGVPDWAIVASGALATVYVTCCLISLDGPLDVFVRLRNAAETHRPATLGKMLLCPWCIGFWAALPFALFAVFVTGWAWWSVVMLWLSYAAIAGRTLEVNNMVEVDW